MDSEERALNTSRFRQVLKDARAKLQEVHGPTYVLIILFAISSWISVNGLWVELPLMIKVLPEGVNLPSYLVLIIQLANVGPALYLLCNRLWPRYISEVPAIYTMLSFGVVASVLLAYTWRFTSYWGDSLQSTSLLLLGWLLSLVDCTSSVLFFPYMAYYPPPYMTALYVGEGLSGFVPGIFGLIQGAGGEPVCVNKTVVVNNRTEVKLTPTYSPPRFPVSSFYMILFGMLLVSGVAFFFLNLLPNCRAERVAKVENFIEKKTLTGERPNKEVLGATGIYRSRKIDDQYSNGGVDNNSYQLDGKSDETSSKNLNQQLEDTASIESEAGIKLSNREFILLMVFTAWLNGMTNGFLASASSYMVLPYGFLTYGLAVRLSSIANPISCFIALFVTHKSVKAVCVLVGLGSLMSFYAVALAIMSPNPPGRCTVYGKLLAILSSVILSVCFSYGKLMIASLLRREGTKIGRKKLQIYGATTQAGSFIGAVLAFLIVTVARAFTRPPTCRPTC